MIYIHSYGVGKFGSKQIRNIYDAYDEAEAQRRVLGGVVEAYAKEPEVRKQHAEWSDKTFGGIDKIGAIGPLKHLAKEAMEAAENPGDLSEWADMQFLLWDAQRRAGINDDQIINAMIEKLKINKERSWPEPKDGEPRHHLKI